MEYSYLERNVAEVRAKIDAACAAAGRENDVMLLAAIKSADVGEIKYIHEKLGINNVGENRVQQLLERYELIKSEGLDIHFIGKLQTNKVKYIIDKVSMIHSLDSIKLAEQIDKQAKKHGIKMKVLVEINSGEEENKSGVMPQEVEAFCLELSRFDSLELCGFMTMAPKCEKKEDYCKYFCKTYKLVLDIWTKKLHNISRPLISMGMSESFEEAILEGADIVRVGRRLFEK
ncbi:MAG: YggS family pyridoxal phosphate-dependent enzyme [Ruminococcaceae bacterium]|nr:YggS family pyridoxal phosphate-dependent enzyme [Oscillospiraceae bacterium]